MTQNLDVMIAFVVIIIGLSMTLQIVMNACKHLLGLRWKVYESFIKQLYRTHFVEGQPVVDVAVEAQSIQSVTHRLQQFSGRLETAAQSAKGLKRALRKFERELKAAPDVDAKAAYIAAQIETELPAVTEWTDQLRALQLDQLLSIYRKMVDSVQKNSVLEGVAKQLAKIEKMLESAERWVATKEQEGIDALEESLATVNTWLDELEAKLREIHTRISANLEDALRQLQERYANRASLWCFYAGIGMCLLLNADSVSMYQTLRASPELAASILAERGALGETVAMPDRTRALNALSDAAESTTTALRAQVDDAAVDAFEQFETDYAALRTALAADVDRFRKAMDGLGEGSLQLTASAGTLAEASAALALAPAERAVQGEAVAAAVDRAIGSLSRDLFLLETGVVKARFDYLLGSELPLGWSQARFAELVEPPGLKAVGRVVLKILGLLVTAILISFGSSFWNDLLKALLGVRGFLRQRKAPEGAADPT